MNVARNGESKRKDDGGQVIGWEGETWNCLSATFSQDARFVWCLTFSGNSRWVQIRLASSAPNRARGLHFGRPALARAWPEY